MSPLLALTDTASMVLDSHFANYRDSTRAVNSVGAGRQHVIAGIQPFGGADRRNY